MQIAPLVRRQVLLEAPSWMPSAPGASRTDKIIQYNDHAGRFANLAGSKKAMHHKELNFDFLFIVKAKTGPTNWGPSADVIIENLCYLVLKMVEK